MLSVSSLVKSSKSPNNAKERIAGIEGDRELVEHGGVSEIFLENVKVMASADEKTPPKETTL